MVADINISADGKRIALRGDLVVHTARKLFDQTPTFEGGVQVDLSAVGETDSAGLALLVHWANCANRAQRKLTYRGASAQLKQLAKISGVGELFAAAK